MVESVVLSDSSVYVPVVAGLFGQQRKGKEGTSLRLLHRFWLWIKRELTAGHLLPSFSQTSVIAAFSLDCTRHEPIFVRGPSITFGSFG